MVGVGNVIIEVALAAIDTESDNPTAKYSMKAQRGTIAVSPLGCVRWDVNSKTLFGTLQESSQSPVELVREGLGVFLFERLGTFSFHS